MAQGSETVREILLEALALKALPRAGWLRAGVEAPESVAAHSWGVAWLAMVMCPPELNKLRVLEIAIIHDLAEVYAGDITPHDNVSRDDKQARERSSLQKLVAGLPLRDMVIARWEEYEQGTSLESQFVKACDKVDMALQARVYSDSGIDTREFIESALHALFDPALRSLIADEGAHTIEHKNVSD